MYMYLCIVHNNNNYSFSPFFQAKVFRNKEIEQDTARFNLETSEIRKVVNA